MRISKTQYNNFFSNPENEKSKTKNGFLGYSIGLDYFYANNKYISFTAATPWDFPMPFLAPLHYYGEQQFLGSNYFGLTNNNIISRFSIGYGLSYAKNSWDLVNFDDYVIATGTTSKEHDAYGLILNSYYQFGNSFFVGIIYRPTLLTPQLKNKLTYEHLISLDLSWKLRIVKNKSW